MLKEACTLERYGRCYQNYENQYNDADGEPLYALMPLMAHQGQSQQYSSQIASLLHAGTWSAIPASDHTKLQVELQIETASLCSLMVTCVRPVGPLNVICLERLYFPQVFQGQFKVTPKSRSLGFRYCHNGDQRLFQVVFPTTFECRLFYDSLQRYGLLTPVWSDMFQFDGGMSWEQNLVTSNQSRAPAGKGEVKNDQLSLLVPVQPVGLSFAEDGPVCTLPAPIGPDRSADPGETRLSSSESDLRQKSGPREIIICSEQEIIAQEEIFISPEIFEKDSGAETLEQLRIINSHDRARRAIISAVLPEEVESLRTSLHQLVSITPEVQSLPSTSGNNDFSFLQPLSLEFHM